MRTALATLIRFSGAAWLVRAITRRKVGILLYHDPDPASLARQLDFLAARYSLIELDRLVDAIHSGDWGTIPPKSLVVTIDDGLAGNRALLDAFHSRDVRPTLFVCSGIVGSLRHFWFMDVPAATAEWMKGLDSAVRNRELEKLGVDVIRSHDPGSRQALSLDELSEMGDTFQLGAHTVLHPILTGCSDEEALEEISRSRAQVAEITGVPCRHFAYPNGCYGEREVKLACEAGYDSARTVDVGWNGRKADPYRLRILSVADDTDNTTLIAELSGLKWLSRILRREGGLDGRFRLRAGDGR